MSRQFDDVLLGSIELFCLAAEHGGFTAAALVAGVTPTAVSRSISRLETRLGLRLFVRTTRSVKLTEVGRTYYEQCRLALGQLVEAEREAMGRQAEAAGTLRISIPTTYGHHRVLPLLPAFRLQHPGVQVHVHLSNRNIDFVEEGYDMAIRVRAQPDSTLIARHLEDAPLVVVATAAYLKRAGTPRVPSDLIKHNCLAISGEGSQRGWTFRENGKKVTLKVAGNMVCNDGEVLHDWALAGKGLAWRSMWEVGPELRAGRLRTVLDQHAAPGNDIYAVFAQRRHLPLRIRAFVDFLRHSYSQPDYWRERAI